MSINSTEVRHLINIIMLGLSFLFLFSAFQTCAMFQTIVLNAAKSAPNSTFTGSGYTSLAIIYLTFAFANFISPVIVVWLSAKYSMFLSAILYILFIATFLHPMNWSLYLGSFLVGVGAAVLWTAQGNFLSMNSNTQTISQNTTIFWALFQFSLIFGNIFQYVMFRQTNIITNQQRTVFFSVFIVVGSIGALMMLIFRKPSADITESLSEAHLLSINTTERYSPFEAFFQSFRLLKTPNMLLLLSTFAYAGFELTFFSSVYGTSVGQTEYFGDKAKGYVGLIGIMIGLGEITSTSIFNLVSRIWKKITPDVIIVIGLLGHIICFYLIFLILPFDSTQKSSSAETFIIPSASVVILCGYLLGFGDSIYNVQIMSLLGDAYKGIDSPSAFAMFFFIRSLASGIGFFYCTYLTMEWQLLILSITGIIGTISFIVIERKIRFTILARNIETSINQN